ncbi:MAG: DUF2264 domain-containing protein [Caldilineaceae bacterium]
MRCALWDGLAPEVQQNACAKLRADAHAQAPLQQLAALRRHHRGVPGPNRRSGIPCADYALRQHMGWYLGDGVYGDGTEFHWDYYNSFVIQPMLLDVLAAYDTDPAWAAMRNPVLARAQRYAVIQERLISPDRAIFPAIGRSLAYRFARPNAAQMALLDQLPAELAPAQVREALTAVIRRMIEAPGTFDDGGCYASALPAGSPIWAKATSPPAASSVRGGSVAAGSPPSHLFWRVIFARPVTAAHLAL